MKTSDQIDKVKAELSATRKELLDKIDKKGNAALIRASLKLEEVQRFLNVAFWDFKDIGD